MSDSSQHCERSATEGSKAILYQREVLGRTAPNRVFRRANDFKIEISPFEEAL